MVSTAARSADFDHHSMEYSQRWPELLEELRDECPIARTGAYGGFWVLTRYQDVRDVALDDSTYSSAHDPDRSDDSCGGVLIPPIPARFVPLEVDPPLLGAFRKLLHPLFTQHVARNWAPFVQRATDYFVDQFIETGRADLVFDLANPVPAVFSLRFLGLPVASWESYARPQHEIVYSAPGSVEQQRAAVGVMRTIDTLRQVVAQRRENPEDDFISTLTHAEIDGYRLADRDVVDTCFLLISGGLDTTTSLFADAVHWLGGHPEHRQRLRERPELIPDATEEFLRYFTPIQGHARTVTKPAAVAGCEFSPGERLYLSWAGANRDPEVFDNPHELLLDRKPNPHMAFGIGAHRCLGVYLARMEFRILLETVLRRMPDFEIEPGEAVKYPSVGTTNGFVTLPARFTPGARIGVTDLV